MTIDRIMLVDVESGGVDPAKDPLVEVAVGVFSVTHGQLVRARSWLIVGETNAAESVNGIRPALLKHGVAREAVMTQVHAIATKECSAIVAHGAEFDRQWFTPEIQRLPWICSAWDIDWPKRAGDSKLASLALANGVGVVSAHRALADVMTLALIFERVGEHHDLGGAVAKAMRPKRRFRALVSYETNALAKQAGFRWSPEERIWWKALVVEDVPSLQLPFRIEEVA